MVAIYEDSIRFGEDRNSHPIFNHGHDKVPLTATTSDRGNKTNLAACLMDHFIQQECFGIQKEAFPRQFGKRDLSVMAPARLFSRN
jgi:hypothetical protein